MNYYELLGIKSDASSEEIKKAYKMQIKKWHPDINKDEEAISITIKLNEAKNILLDENKRKEYDEFLNNKDTNTYQKYRNEKKEESKVTKNDYNENYEEKMVTKWEYLKEYLKYKEINIFRRIIALIFVLLESLLCFILKILIISISFLCYFLSDLIINIFRILSPILIILVIYLVYIISINDFNKIITDNIVELRGIIIIIVTYIFGLILPIIGNKLISQKVFYLLYNKLDVYLFKKAVGYEG